MKSVVYFLPLSSPTHLFPIHMNDYCGFCAASQGSVEKPVARESLRTHKILAAFVPASPVQIHPGDHLSKELYEALKFTGITSGFAMEEEVGGIVSPEAGAWAVCVCIFFFGFMGARQDFRDM